MSYDKRYEMETIRDGNFKSWLRRMIHPKVEEAFQEIDAVVKSYDGLDQNDLRTRLSDFLVRWQTAVNEYVVDMQERLERYEAEEYDRQQSI